MRRGLFVITALGLGIFLVALTGCAGSSAPARLYVLTPAPEARAAPLGAAVPGGPALGVGPVRLPGLLDRPQIVTRRGADEIDEAEFHRWGEPLADSVPRILAENLAALRETERVALFAWDPAPAVQRQVVVDVMRFDGAMGGDVVLDARWRILATRRPGTRGQPLGSDSADRRNGVSGGGGRHEPRPGGAQPGDRRHARHAAPHASGRVRRGSPAFSRRGSCHPHAPHRSAASAHTAIIAERKGAFPWTEQPLPRWPRWPDRLSAA